MHTYLSELVKIRLASQQLLASTFKSGKELVNWFGAIQGQEYAQTKWGLGMRLPKLKDPEIERELTDGAILRTHLLRPTWHFVSPADIRWLLKLTAPRIKAASAFMFRQVELNDTVFRKCNRILTRLLQGGRHLTRAEINNEFRKNKIVADGHRLSYIMMQAELDAIICSGARKGNQFTYALLDYRAPGGKILDKEASLAELSERYFRSRGPATVNDYAIWSGLTIADCRIGIELIKNKLEKITSGNRTYYFTNNVLLKKHSASGVFLLPPYDEYIMGYKDRSAIFEFKNSLNPDPSLRHVCMIIKEGQVIGTWKRTLAKSRIILEYDLFSLQHNSDSGMERIINRYSEFNKLPVISGSLNDNR
jgi:hypothetical protein